MGSEFRGCSDRSAQASTTMTTAATTSAAAAAVAATSVFESAVVRDLRLKSGDRLGFRV